MCVCVCVCVCGWVGVTIITESPKGVLPLFSTDSSKHTNSLPHYALLLMMLLGLFV